MVHVPLTQLSLCTTVTLCVAAAPAITSELEDQYIDIGGEVYWSCEASADPPPQYKWLKNANPFSNDTIDEEDRDRITISGNEVHINHVMSKDNGMYQCAAFNTHGEAYTSAELRTNQIRQMGLMHP